MTAEERKRELQEAERFEVERRQSVETLRADAERATERITKLRLAAGEATATKGGIGIKIASEGLLLEAATNRKKALTTLVEMDKVEGSLPDLERRRADAQRAGDTETEGHYAELIRDGNRLLTKRPDAEKQLSEAAKYLKGDREQRARDKQKQEVERQFLAAGKQEVITRTALERAKKEHDKAKEKTAKLQAALAAPPAAKLVGAKPRRRPTPAVAKPGGPTSSAPKPSARRARGKSAGRTRKRGVK